MEKLKIGEVLLYSFRLDNDWTKKDLYNELIKKSKVPLSDEDSTRNTLYDKFFIKIYGNYDESILQNSYKCYSCPYNDEYRKFDDYNELRDEQEKVLVLVSRYLDFRDYKIYCSYFSDKLVEGSDNVFVYGENDDILKKITNIFKSIF